MGISASLNLFFFFFNLTFSIIFAVLVSVVMIWEKCEISIREAEGNIKLERMLATD